MTPSRISLIVAVAENGVIGAKGALPWHIPEDLKRFKQLTLGKPCIMGRKTWDSLPKKPLPGRTNIVVTRDLGFQAQGARAAHSFDEALSIARHEQPDEIMVIGGEAIFAAALAVASRIYLTEIAARPEGDAHMPPLSGTQWREAQREGPYSAGGLLYRYVTLERAG